MPLESFAKYPLLFGPSPVHRLDRLTRHLGGAPIWAKREDCNSGIAYGGNKTPKLEYLVADALPGDATRSYRSAGCSPTTPGWWGDPGRDRAHGHGAVRPPGRPARA